MVINIQQATKRFGSQTVLDQVDLQIQAGERVILLGQNGAGKTTLLRCLLGDYQLDHGSVSIMGFNPSTEREKALKNVAFIPQLPPPLPFSLKALWDFATNTSGLDREEAFEYCHRFDLPIEEQLNKPFNKLSGGMKQKVLASLAFARHCPIMLFDEPTANLDVKGRETFAEIIREPLFAHTTMIFISHRLEELQTTLDRALYMDLGRIVKDEAL